MNPRSIVLKEGAQTQDAVCYIIPTTLQKTEWTVRSDAESYTEHIYVDISTYIEGYMEKTVHDTQKPGIPQVDCSSDYKSIIFNYYFQHFF